MKQTSRIAFCLLAFVFVLSSSKCEAFWRLPCPTPVTTQRVDPIVNPGGYATHIHTVVGSSGFHSTSTTSSIKQATCSTCMVYQDMSNYWIPNLYYERKDGFLEYVSGGGMTVYYLQRVGRNANEPIYAFPDGFQIIAGDPKRTTYNDSILADKALSYACLDYNNPSPETPGFPTKNCPDGLRAQVFFPSCWNGKDVDSADHRSHMAYPSGVNSGDCPATHPVRLISIFYEVFFDINKYKDGWLDANGKPFRDWPFLFSTGDRTGYSLHGDFMNGWNRTVLQAAINNCTDDSGDIRKCQEFALRPDGFDKQCKLDAPLFDPNEQVYGMLWDMPGHPEVRKGAPNPGSVYQKGCFVDPTNPRVWPNKVLTDANMTPQKCIQAAIQNNFTYAGLEYGQECYAGNVLPNMTTIDGCRMACGGSTVDIEFCGGPGALTVWTTSGKALVAPNHNAANALRLPLMVFLLEILIGLIVLMN